MANCHVDIFGYDCHFLYQSIHPRRKWAGVGQCLYIVLLNDVFVGVVVPRGGGFAFSGMTPDGEPITILGVSRVKVVTQYVLSYLI